MLSKLCVCDDYRVDSFILVWRMALCQNTTDTISCHQNATRWGNAMSKDCCVELCCFLKTYYEFTRRLVYFSNLKVHISTINRHAYTVLVYAYLDLQLSLNIAKRLLILSSRISQFLTWLIGYACAWICKCSSFIKGKLNIQCF